MVFRSLLLLVILAGVFAIGNSPLRPKPFSDGYFHEEAKGLARALRTGRLSEAVPLVHSPGPPFYYLIPYLLVPREAPERTYWIAGVAWNCLALWISAVLLGAAGRRIAGMAGERVAELAVPVTFFPLYYSAGIASETPAYLAAAATVWAGLRLVGEVSLRWMAMFGVCLGLLVVMRGNYVLSLPLALACAMLMAQRKARLYVGSAVAIGGLVAGGVFAGTAWLNRAIGADVRQDSFLTHVLVQGAFQYRTEAFDWRAWEREAREGSKDYEEYAAVRQRLGEIHRSTGRAMASVEWEWLRASVGREPWVWLRMAPFKAASALWFRISPERVKRVLGEGWLAGWIAFCISAVLNAPNLLLLALALMVTRRAERQRMPEVAMCWVPFLAGLLFVAFTYSEPRYIVPGLGGLAVLGGLGIVCLGGRCEAVPEIRDAHGR